MDMPAAPPPSADTAAPPAMEGPMAPPPPPEGYSERTIKDLAKALGLSLNAVMGAMGAKDIPAVPEPDKALFTKGKMMAPLPAFVVQEVAMLIGAAAQMGGKVEGRYDVDVPAMLADDAGLEKLTDLLKLIVKDKPLLAAIKEAAKAAPAMAEGKKEAKYDDKDSAEHEAAESPEYEAAEEKGAAMTDYV